MEGVLQGEGVRTRGFPKKRRNWQSKKRQELMRRATKDHRPTNPNVVWKRIDEGLDLLVHLGLHEFKTVISRLYLFDVLSKMQVQAAEHYATLAGRYARYHNEEKLRRDAGSPAFQRAFRGYDNELQRHLDNGTMDAYEARAISAKKKWEEILECIPNTDARRMLDAICLDDREIPSRYYPDLAIILDKIAKRFWGRGDTKRVR